MPDVLAKNGGIQKWERVIGIRVTQFVHSLENDQSNPGAHVYTYSKGPEKVSQAFEQKWKFAGPLEFCLI